MLIKGIIPPSGVKESCIELTAPQLVSVVTTAHSAELAMPKRTSLPSMLPAGCTWLAEFWTSGFPRASAEYVAVTPTRNKIAIAHHTAHPWRGEPVICPSVYVKADPMAKIKTSSKKFVSGVGFSYGCALLV